MVGEFAHFVEESFELVQASPKAEPQWVDNLVVDPG